MKLPFIIYVQAIGIYLLLSLPAIIEPGIYMISAIYAIASGFAAMAVFAGVFFVLHLIRPSVEVAFSVLFITVLIAVAVAYRLLLWVEMPERSFWLMDGYTLFPIAAVISGWIGLAVNHKKLTEHFSPSLYDDVETIFS